MSIRSNGVTDTTGQQISSRQPLSAPKRQQWLLMIAMILLGALLLSGCQRQRLTGSDETTAPEGSQESQNAEESGESTSNVPVSETGNSGAEGSESTGNEATGYPAQSGSEGAEIAVAEGEAYPAPSGSEGSESAPAQGTPTEGEGSAAEGEASGEGTPAEGEASGEGTPAEGEGSAAEGEGTPAEGEGSAAEGEGTPAEGEGSAAEGEGTPAEGEGSAAEGESTPAEGEGSAAEGEGTPAEGEGSAAEGEGTPAEGEGSAAEGEGTPAEGEASAAEGEASAAEGEASAAEGEASAAEGEASAAEGSASEGSASQESSEAASDSGATEAKESNWASNLTQVEITSDKVDVRNGPGPYNPIIGSLLKGDKVAVIGKNLDSSWYYVKLTAELDGWIMANATKGLGDFKADELNVLKFPALPAPTPTAAPSEPTAAPSEPTAAPSEPTAAPSEPTAAPSEPTAEPTAAPSEPTAAPTAVPSEPTAVPSQPSTGLIYGIQAHLIDIDRSLPLANTTGLGFGWIKQQVEWKVWEPSQGNINWGQMDAVVQEAQASGLTVLYSAVGAPDWAREGGFDGSVAGPPADPATFANFLSQMASRYCNQGLGAIEVWNEQNLHYEWGNKPLNPADYIALLKPSYEAIKAACPSMIVVSGALTPAGNVGDLAIDDFTYLQGMFDNGLAQYADVVGVHPSGFNVPPSVRYTEACDFITQKGTTFKGPCDTPHHSWSFLSTLEGYRDIIQEKGSNQKIWVTEFGWAAGGSFAPSYEYADDNSLDEQAQWSVEAYQYMRNADYVDAAFLWNLNFRVIADGTEKAQWGILANNTQPLPAYQALQAMEK